MLTVFPRVARSALAVSLFVAGVAAAQSPQPAPPKSYSPEIVVTRTGQLVAPWKELRNCTDSVSSCVTVVANTQTHEIAKLNDRWTTRFEATGNGKEVRRAEPALDKAIRLTPNYKARPQAK